jgi:hypothetical protein
MAYRGHVSQESVMPKKPSKPITDVQLSIDASAETMGLDHLVTAKDELTEKFHADQRFAVSVKEAIKLLDMGKSRFNELLSAKLIGSYLDGKSRKILVRSLYLYQLRLLDQAIDVEAERMDRLGIPGAAEWLNPIRKA